MKYLLAISTFLFLFSCKTEKDTFQLETGEEYFPLTVGKYVEYEMDSTIYDPNGMEMVRQSITQLREEIVDTLRNANDELIYKIEQFTRFGDTTPWTIQNVYTTSITNNQAQRTEENLKFIKMTFPLRDNQSWNGNAFIDEGTIVTVAGETIEMFKGWDYRVKEVDLVDTIGGQIFEPVVLIEQADNENAIELRRSVEKYAPNVGLIYKEISIFDTQCIEGCEGQPWSEKAEKGFTLIQKILNYN
ncbi:MAG: hypothetical protein ACJAVF_002145 [Paraglaciecola sp.]